MYWLHLYLKLACIFFMSLTFANEYSLEEISVYDFLIERPGYSIFLNADDGKPSEISIDIYKELNVKANLLMTKTNAFGGVQNLYLRGSEADRIQITYDGAVLNDPSHPSRGYNFSELASYQISEIDIYNGPHTTNLGSFANTGALALKSRKIDTAQVLQKLGSYESFGTSILVPIKNLKQQWEFQRLSSRGMSSYIDGQEHDEFLDHQFNIKGELKLPSSFEVNYFVLTRWREEDLDFGGGTDPDDINYISKDNMILPYLKIKNKLTNCVELNSSVQKTFRKRETENLVDAINSNESIFVYKSELEILKVQMNQNCATNFPSQFSLEHNKEIMSSLESGDQSSEITNVEQKIDSFSFAQDFIVNNKNRFFAGGKLDFWEGQTKIGAYQLGYNVILSNNLLITPSYSFARRIPSLFQLFSSYGDPSLGREKNWQLELSVSQQNQTFRWEIIPFYSYYEDMIDYNNLTQKYSNFGENKIFGIESKNNLKLNSKWGTGLNLNYLRAYNLINSNELLLRPKWQFSQTIHYLLEKTSFELQAQYISRRAALDPFSSARIETSSNFLLHFLLSNKISNKLKLDLSIQNLLNKKYATIPGYSALGLSAFSEISYTF